MRNRPKKKFGLVDLFPTTCLLIFIWYLKKDLESLMSYLYSYCIFISVVDFVMLFALNVSYQPSVTKCFFFIMTITSHHVVDWNWSFICFDLVYLFWFQFYFKDDFPFNFLCFSRHICNLLQVCI